MDDKQKDLWACLVIGLVSGFCFIVHSYRCIYNDLDALISIVGFIGLCFVPLVSYRFVKVGETL